jgi:hypothetical protein
MFRACDSVVTRRRYGSADPRPVRGSADRRWLGVCVFDVMLR